MPISSSGRVIQDGSGRIAGSLRDPTAGTGGLTFGRRGSWRQSIEGFSKDMLEQAQKNGADLAKEVEAEAKRIAPVDTGAYRASIQTSRDGLRVWKWRVFSPLPYAEALEFGHSQQAPRGVLRVALETVRNRYR